jgi:hypothetical protein
MEVDSIYTSGDHLKGGGLLGGVYTLQETGLTGPISIYKLVPKVPQCIHSMSIFKSPKHIRAHQWAWARTGIKAKEHRDPATEGVLRVVHHRESVVPVHYPGLQEGRETSL